MVALLGTVLQDLRYGARTLRRSPGFTISAVLCLALGIGANTAIFSVVNAVVLRPLPVEKPSRLVQFATRQAAAGRSEASWIGNSSYPDYIDARDGGGDVFSGVAGVFTTHMSLTLGDESERIVGALVTGNYFDLLGVRAAAGRTFASEEDALPGGREVAVLSNALWRDRFASDPGIAGRPMTLNGHPFTVIGVAPPSFNGTESDRAPAVWVPMATQSLMMGGVDWLAKRGSAWMSILGRLRDGVAIGQAQAKMDLVFEQIALAHPDSNRGRSVVLERASRVGPQDRGQIAFILGLLSAVAAIVLLVACVNVANLLLARASARGREMAVKVSLGAGRGRLVRQLLTEGLLISAAGGALAILLGSWSGDLFHALELPASIDLSPDVRVFAYTLGASILTTILFGLTPALHATKMDILPALKDSARAAGYRRGRLRPALAVAQVGLSVLLLVTAGLFLRSVQKARAVDPGFDPSHVLTFAIDPGMQGYPEEGGREIYRSLLSRIEASQGITSASIAAYVPLGHAWEGNGVIIEGQEPASEDDTPGAGVNVVGPGYFRTLRLPLRSGREFTDRDEAASPGVAVVNESMARRFWPGQDPIGKRVRIAGENERWHEVVGVAQDSKYMNLTESPRALIYLPFLQHYRSGSSLLVRTEGDPLDAVAGVRAEVRAIDRSLPVFKVASLADYTTDAEERRFTATLLGIFGGIGLLLAVVGLYGLVSCMVSGRTQEIGVRMAMGATPRAVGGLILGQSLRLVAAGLSLGLTLALILTQLLRSELFGIAPTDLVTFAAVSALLTASAMIAAWFPARRAMRVDPVVALRTE